MVFGVEVFILVDIVQVLLKGSHTKTCFTLCGKIDIFLGFVFNYLVLILMCLCLLVGQLCWGLGGEVRKYKDNLAGVQFLILSYHLLIR